MGILDRLFRDRATGRVVVAQWPNPPLLAWGLLTLAVAVFRPEGVAEAVLRAAAAVALAWWAVDEVARGVNPFRRILGGLVLVGLAMSLIAGARS